jgi:hypothetical protein
MPGWLSRSRRKSQKGDHRITAPIVQLLVWPGAVAPDELVATLGLGGAAP